MRRLVRAVSIFWSSGSSWAMRADLVSLAFLAVSVLSSMSRSRYCSSSAMTVAMSWVLAGLLSEVFVVSLMVLPKGFF